MTFESLNKTSSIISKLKTKKNSYFLGIEVTQSTAGIVIPQRKCALNILKETRMLEYKFVDTPNISFVVNKPVPTITSR